MPRRIHIGFFKTEYGELIIGSFGEKLCLCDWRLRKMRDRIDYRIIGTDGSLTGYAGGTETKRKLLRHENAFLQGELKLF